MMKTIAALILVFVAYAAAGGARHKMTQAEIAADKYLLAGLDLEVDKYNKAHREQSFRSVRHSVVAATRQVVAGNLYEASVRFVVSTCKNVEENDGKTIVDCPAQEHQFPVFCMLSVWSRPWMKDPKMRLITKTKGCTK